MDLLRSVTFMFLVASLAVTDLLAQFPLEDPKATTVADADAGLAFEPDPLSQRQYAVSAVPEVHYVEYDSALTGDRESIYVESWLPAPNGTSVPPPKVPAILVMTPYGGVIGRTVNTGPPGTPFQFKHTLDSVRDSFVPRGYAVAVGHVRGSGRSSGCVDLNSAADIEATSRVIEYLGRDAGWSSGRVGMYGLSADAITQIGVASRGNASQTQYLKAIVPLAALASEYDTVHLDGVPLLDAQFAYVLYNGLIGLPEVPAAPPADPAQLMAILERFGIRYGCAPDIGLERAGTNVSGDFSRFWQERDSRPALSNIRAATLMVHGFADEKVLPNAAWMFSRIASTTPHKLVLGQWGHGYPDESADLLFPRGDFEPMVQAWFDHYLLGLPTRVEQWPAVQVQHPDGQWRVEPDWPSTGGPVGQIALAAAGETTFQEASGEAVFTIAALSGPLHITGMPVLDLWLRLDRADAHLRASIETLDASGEPVVHSYGARSAQHLQPLTEGYFRQSSGAPADITRVVHMPIRLMPTDLIVPKGGTLRIRVTGAGPAANLVPSGGDARVTILHDCAQASALRFVMPRERAQLINVRDREAAGERLRSSPSKKADRTGGGLATEPLCGKPPVDPQQVTMQP